MPTSAASWSLDPAVVSALQTPEGYDLGALGRLVLHHVVALVEPGEDFLEDAPLEVRSSPLGVLRVGEPLFWGDHGFFTVESTPDAFDAQQIGSYRYGFVCSNPLLVAVGSPLGDDQRMRRAEPAEIEPHLSLPPPTADGCAAWLTRRLTEPPSLDSELADWLVIEALPLWNPVLQLLAQSEAPAVSIAGCSVAQGGVQFSESGLHPRSRNLLPAFTVSGVEWYLDGDSFQVANGDVRIPVPMFLRGVGWLVVLHRAFEQSGSTLDGPSASKLHSMLRGAGLPAAMFERALPY